MRMSNIDIILLFFVLIGKSDCLANCPIIGHAFQQGIRFMASSGFRYVSIISFNSCCRQHLVPKTWSYVRQERIYFRVLRESSQHFLPQDSLIIITDFAEQIDDLTADKYVSYLLERKVKRSLILAMPSSETSINTGVLDVLLKAANDSNENLQFYLLINTFWYQIINIKNTEKAIALPFNASSKSNEWDLQGITITDISTQYMPHNGASECNELTRICNETKGILPNIFDAVAKRINITIRHIYDPNGNWGLTPVSGTTINVSSKSRRYFFLHYSSNT